MKKILFGLQVCISLAAYGQYQAIEFTKAVSPNLPGQFIENKGQIIDQNGNARPDVKYVFCAPGFKAAFMEDGISYELYKNEAEVAEHPAGYQKGSLTDQSPTALQVNRIDVRFGNSKPTNIQVQGRSEAFLTYHIAPNLEPGINDVHGYKKLVYKNVWPNIDLEFSADASGFLKYNIVVHPGGDLRYVEFRYGGADITHLPNSLRLSTSQGVIQESIPHSFLTEDGAPVVVQYNAEHNVVGFDANYDRSKTLVIDPVLAWDSTVGSGVKAYKFCRDSKGNLYFGGSSSTTTYIVTSGAYQSTVSGGTDAFLVKIKPDRKIVWGTLYGTSSNDEAQFVSCNDSVVYIVGSTATTSGLATSGAYQTSSGGGKSDIYLAKFYSNGNLGWGTYFGDTLAEWLTGAGCDRQGNAYFVGAGEYWYSSMGSESRLMNAKFNSKGQKVSSFENTSTCDEGWYTGFNMDKDGNPLSSWFVAICAYPATDIHATGSGGGYYLHSSDALMTGGIWGDSAGRVYWIMQDSYGNKLLKMTSAFKTIKNLWNNGANNFPSVSDMASDKWSNMYVLDYNGYVDKYDSASNLQWKIYIVKSGWGSGPTYFHPSILNGLSDNFYILANDGKYVAEYRAYSDLKLVKYTSSLNACYGTKDAVKFLVQNPGDKSTSKVKYHVSITGPDTLQITDSSMTVINRFDTTELKVNLPKPLKIGTYKIVTYIEKNGLNEFANGDTLTAVYNVRYVKGEIAGSDSVFCVNDTVTLRDSSYAINDNISTVGWSVGGDYVSGGTLKKSFNQSGTYTVLLTAKTPYCSDAVEKKVYIHNYPSPNFVFNFAGNCQGSNVLFTNKTDSLGENSVTYLWDFGDGEYSASVSPNHIFKKSGSFKVTLTAVTLPHCSQTISKTITIHPLPIPAFTWSNVCEGEKVAFTNQSTIAANYTIVSYLWRFGDGATATVINPQHKYASAGNYEVTLITKSNSGCTDSVTKTVTVYPRPKADFLAADVCQGNAMQFTDNSSVSQGSVSKYFWIFDATDTSTAQNPKYTFNDTGAHTVYLAVETNLGCRDSVSKVVRTYPIPDAAYTFSVSAQNVTFSANDPNQFSYLWNFGDGNSSTSANPAHAYAATGKYAVKLTVKSSKGCESTFTDSVTINTIGLAKSLRAHFNVNIFPNPFTNVTTLEYTLSKPSNIEARLYDMQGNELAVIVRSTKQNAGKYAHEISAEKLNLTSGMYLIKLIIDDKVMNEQVVVLK
jgi:PKD repeat protein